MGKRILAFLLMLLTLVPHSVAGGMWAAEPIDVHEWGVNDFDWVKGKGGEPVLPDFMYTDKRPGKPFPAAGQRVKDMPTDSGIRKKPILYFYPRGHRKETSVGVELRFSYGYANAWWPQANVYRTPEQTAKAKPIDWKAWREKNRAVRGGGGARVPDDGRMELVWHDLKLTPSVPGNLTLPGNNLGKDHWVKVAREVDSHYVSNGKEAERYLFYEGKNSEMPAIAILPPEDNETTWSLVNVSDHPIHDIIAIYHTKRRGPVWVGHMATLPPVPKMKRDFGLGHDVEQITAMGIPDFDKWPKNRIMSDDAYELRTSAHLVESLSRGKHLSQRWYSGMRDPADPQPPTKVHSLYRKEAVALEKIWRKDFFQSEGLTIIYRESTEYLDKAMPLNIYTDMRHFVRLSRCGLVLNRGIPYKQAKSVMAAVQSRDAGVYNRHRIMAIGHARYLMRIRPNGYKHLPGLIERLKKGK